MKTPDRGADLKRLLPKAGQGDFSAVFELGMLYLTAENWEEAYFWLSLFSKWPGRKKPGKDEFGAGLHLTREQKEAVEKRVADWEPAPVAEEVQQALAALQLKAGREDAKAQYDLGELYRNGHHYWSGWGVAEDHTESLKWWRRAAENGYAEAQFKLGEAFSKGLGVKPDYVEAMKWYRMAADQGHTDAQANIGFLSAQGYGDKR